MERSWVESVMNSFFLKRFPWAVLLVFALSASAGAQDDDDIELAAARVDTFFNSLQQAPDEPEAALEDLTAGGPLADRDDDIADLAARCEALEEKYGAFLAAERVGAKRVGDDLLFLRYIYKAEQFPVVWYFTWYRPPLLEASPTWRLISVRFDTRLELLGL